MYQTIPRRIAFSCHASGARVHFLPERSLSARPGAGQDHHEESPMSAAIRQASNVIVTAALLYKELAISASDLLRPGTYRSL